jgi:hypothetical protein
MRYPFFKCAKCGAELAETSFPLLAYPSCPTCGAGHVDVAIGNDTTPVYFCRDDVPPGEYALALDDLIIRGESNG